MGSASWNLPLILLAVALLGCSSSKQNVATGPTDWDRPGWSDEDARRHQPVDVADLVVPEPESALKLDNRGGVFYASVDLLTVAAVGTKNAIVGTFQAVKENPWPSLGALGVGYLAYEEWIAPDGGGDPDPGADIQITINRDGSMTVNGQNLTGTLLAKFERGESGSYKILIEAMQAAGIRAQDLPKK